jgi:metal iron transporter
LALSLFFFAMFVNSAILIVSGASLSNLPADQVADADLFSIHDLLSRTLAPAAGTIFALGLLLSGTSAGIVCTISGQIVSEGQLNWTIKPWARRLITRAISITPSIIVAGAVGRKGLSTALEASQVALSVILPFVSAPLIYFTCRSSVMSVWAEDAVGAGTTSGGNRSGDCTGCENCKGETPTRPDGRCQSIDHNEQSIGAPTSGRMVVMRNSWLTTGFALVIWTVIVIMNVALLVLVGLGKG